MPVYPYLAVSLYMRYYTIYSLLQFFVWLQIELYMGICLEFLIPHVVMLQPFSKIDYIYFVQLKILHTIPDNHKIKRD